VDSPLFTFHRRVTFFPAVGRANIGVLVDGSMKKHLGMVERWLYNLVLLFQRGSLISFGTYGGGSVSLVRLSLDSYTERIKNLKTRNGIMFNILTKDLERLISRFRH